MKIGVIYSLVSILVFVLDGECQKSTSYGPPVINQPCPDYILSQIINYDKKTTRVTDLLDKPVVLEFWGMACSSCVKNMPKLNDLQKKYNGKVQIFLVGFESETTDVKAFYLRLIERYKLILPSAFDNELFNVCGITGIPTQVWVNADGIVNAITTGSDLNEENINAFIAGRKLESEQRVEEGKLDITKPLLIRNNGSNDSDFIHRSILTPFINAIGGFSTIISDTTSKITVCSGIKDIFGVAYGQNKYYPGSQSFPYSRISLESNDTTKFNESQLYCYELIVPKNRSRELRKLMQQDLETVFGLEANIVFRDIKVNELIVTRNSNGCLSKGGEASIQHSVEGVAIRNETASSIAETINLYIGGTIPLTTKLPDEARYDVKFNAVMTEMDDVVAELNKCGLGIVESKKEMATLVLSN